MDVHVGEMNSTVRMTDSQSMLSPEVFERIVRAVMQRMREERAHEERVEKERRIRPRASAVEGTSWE
ncbi:MAG: hypothetical protein A3K13_08190 [Gemmatimonadetes bacterium RIFCSPLOWO2_12_FULL_68_9]|nr:MAG: hypothetical protein A3K13_08190 [Gemmatimonadetes bacterium RIFCSPLOWO2_12_FULL_68_9]